MGPNIKCLGFIFRKYVYTLQCLKPAICFLIFHDMKYVFLLTIEEQISNLTFFPCFGTGYSMLSKKGSVLWHMENIEHAAFHAAAVIQGF